jgi:hypothetical protein
MNTTNLFVELIVIGIGAAIWITLFVFSFLGYTWAPTPDKWFSFAVLIPTVSVIYVLGIIVDRLADSSFEKLWSKTIRNKWFQNIDEYYRARRLIYKSSERIGDLLEYGRSRMRISRGWAFNAALIFVGFNLFMALQSPHFDSKLLVWIVGAVALALLTYGAYFSWLSIIVTEYRKVKEHTEFVNGQRPSHQQHRGRGRGRGRDRDRDRDREQKR